jgi:hypothetical protein
MIMRDDHGSRVPLERELHDLARMHARPVDRAAKQFLELNEAVALIEIDAALTIYWIAI